MVVGELTLECVVFNNKTPSPDVCVNQLLTDNVRIQVAFSRVSMCQLHVNQVINAKRLLEYFDVKVLCMVIDSFFSLCP